VAQSDILDPVLKISKVMSSLRAMTEPRGLSQQSVTRDDDRVSDRLTTVEQNRLKESATIIGKVLKIGAFKEGPEAARLQDLTPMQTQAIKSAPTAIKDKIQPPKSNLLGDLLSSLLGLLGLGALTSIIGKIKNWLLDKLTKFILTPMKQLFSWVGNKLWTTVKWVGEKLWSAMKYAGGKIWNSVKWVGSKIWNGVKWLGSKISNWAGKLADKIKNSEFFKGFMSKVQAAKDGLKSIWDDAINAVKGYIDDIAKYITSIKNAALTALEKIPGYNLAKKGVDIIGKGAAVVGGAVSKGAAVVGRGAAAIGGVAAEELGNIIKTGKQKIGSYVGGLFKSSAGKLGSFFKGIPIISGIIEGLFASYDIRNLKKDYELGKLSLDELRLKAGKRVAQGIGGVGGSVLGAAAGSVIGGPIGTLIGGIGGDILGRYLGDLLIEKVVSPNITKKLGAFVTDTGEMQDFLVKNGNVYKFNSRDEVLGMKTGGAIDNLMTNLTQNLAKDNSVIRDASVAQVNKLDELIYLMTELIKKPTQGSSNVNNFGNMANNSRSKSFNIRDQFASQTLIPITPQPI
jgi:hypothetical protein